MRSGAVTPSPGSRPGTGNCCTCSPPGTPTPRSAYRDLDATLAGIERRRDNISQAWSWLGSYEIGRDHAGRMFGDVQAVVMPKLTEHTPDELGALVRTLSFYARLTPGQRQALDREHERIYQRLGRPLRASTIAVLLTARRADPAAAKGRQ